MALKVQLGGRLMSPLSWAAPPDRWLIRLRWLAITGMLLTTLVAEWLVPGLRHRPLLTLLGIIAASNLAWLALVLKMREPGDTVPWQLAVDVLFLGAVLWFSGGLDNPFAGFLSFQIVLAGLLASRKTTVLIAGLVVIVAGLLWTAPALPLETAWLGAWVVRALAGFLAVAALGLVTGAFVVVFLHRLEVLRERSARAEQLAGLGRIVAALCHELNTPLGTILIAAKDLAAIGVEINNPEVDGLAQTVVDQARRASDIIGLLRGQVRPGTQLETMDLGEFLTQYAQSELRRLGFGGALTADLPTGLHAQVFRAALCQIFTNLLTNAVDALGDQPNAKLTLTATHVDRTIQIVLADNGPGIDPSLGGRIGEPFQSTKAHLQGTGLGLFVSTLLCERMDGSLALESQPGRGTQVTVSLRAMRPSLERAAVKPDTGPEAAEST